MVLSLLIIRAKPGLENRIGYLLFVDIKKQRLLKRIISDVKKTLSDRYGLDLDIEVGGKPNIPGVFFVDPDKFVVKIKSEIPLTVRDYNHSGWDDERYAFGPRIVNKTIKESLGFFGFELWEDYSLLSLVYPRDINISPYNNYTIENDRARWVKYGTTEDGELKPNPYFIVLDELDFIISKKSGLTYMLLNLGGVDFSDTGNHLSHIENIEWWDSLSSEDKDEIESAFG